MSPPNGRSLARTTAARCTGSISSDVDSTMSVWSAPTYRASSCTNGASGVARSESAVKLSA